MDYALPDDYDPSLACKKAERCSPVELLLKQALDNELRSQKTVREAWGEEAMRATIREALVYPWKRLPVWLPTGLVWVRARQWPD